jgi:hypothetical protein
MKQKTQEKVVVGGRERSVWVGPRGGRYVEMNGGMVSLPSLRIPSSRRTVTVVRRGARQITAAEVAAALQPGIDAIFDTCRKEGRIDRITVHDFRVALYLYYKFLSKYQEPTMHGTDKCTCSLMNWPKLQEVSIVPAKMDPTDIHTQLNIACHFIQFLGSSVVIEIPFVKGYYLNAVEEFCNTSSLEDVVSECPVEDEFKNGMKGRLCSWHPMHDYLLKVVLGKRPPVERKGRSSASPVGTSRFASANVQLVAPAKRVTEKSALFRGQVYAAAS